MKEYQKFLIILLSDPFQEDKYFPSKKVELVMETHSEVTFYYRQVYLRVFGEKHMIYPQDYSQLSFKCESNFEKYKKTHKEYVKLFGNPDPLLWEDPFVKYNKIKDSQRVEKDTEEEEIKTQMLESLFSLAKDDKNPEPINEDNDEEEGKAEVNMTREVKKVKKSKDSNTAESTEAKGKYT